MKMLTLDKFEEASEKVKEVTLETKLVYSDYLSDQTGNKVYLKPENMQFTGAYKVRGAYYKISTLSEEERQRGLITASAGNHAQGVAYAAKCYGCKAVIVMPTTTPLIKVNRTKSYGAEVVLYGDVYDEACAHALELAEKEGYTFIHPFDDLAVATGQGTIAMEIVQELPLVDYILVPIGGGGLAFGINSGAYVAEIVRSGIMSIDQGQTEAGRSLGLNFSQTMRLIIIPQAFKNVLPALVNEFIVLIKETSIIGYIGMMDLTKGAMLIQSRTYNAFWPLMAAAAIYLVIVGILTWGMNKLERRLRTSER